MPRTKWRGSLGVMVVALLLVGATFALPFLPRSASAKERELITILKLVREQIELYRRHHGSYPPESGEGLKVCMTQYTRRDHQTSPFEDEARGFVYGPYLLAFPENPYTGSSEVSTAGSGSGRGWYYEPRTGEFRTYDGVNDHL